MRIPLLLSLALGLAVSDASSAQEAPVAFTGARLIPIAGPEIADGVLVIHNGRITALGGADTPIPLDATSVDASGRVIMPGLVDTHSHVGEPWGGDASGPLHPAVRVIDSLNVRHPSIQRAQAGGITVANLMPGSGHLMSGQTAYLKLRDGRSLNDLLLRHEDGRAMGGMKMANGTNSQRDAPFPGTRGKSAALVRELFTKAQAYAAKKERAGDDVEKQPELDLEMEALLEVLDGRRVVHHHTHRHDDIMTVLRLADEFGFRVVLQHASEAWKVADEIAAAGVPASVILIDSPGGKLEAADMNWATAGVLEKAGVDVAMHTDDAILDSRIFLRSAALAHRAGMSREGALASVTLAGAKMLELDDRLGSLEVGKDADLVVLSGDPLSTYTHVEQTWIDGEQVFDLSQEQDRLWATGGWGASEGSGPPPHMCCFGRIK
ncbi:MAG: amidohydrolase [Planctomycetota bacterium]|nr:MAG: amidohydrolase [Planctomycetota bacterium]